MNTSTPIPSELFAQTERGYTKPRYGEPGARYGELTLVEEVGRSPNGDVIWKCQCDCGHFAYRTTARLNWVVRTDGSPCCARCLQELRAGKQVEYYQRRHDQMLDLWFERRTLWSEREVENLKIAIMNDLEEEIGPLRDDEEEMPEQEPWWPIMRGDVAYAQHQMQLHKDLADEERENRIEREKYLREKEERHVRELERLNQVDALEALMRTMCLERGFDLRTIRDNMIEWISEGKLPSFHYRDVEARAERAQMVINGILLYDKRYGK